MTTAAAEMALVGSRGAREDGRVLCFALCLAAIFLLPGLRAGGTPVPSVGVVVLVAFVLLQPPIERAALVVYGLCAAYLLALASRNALSYQGGIRDFLYVGIVGLQFALYICLNDIFRHVGLRRLGRWVLGFAAFATLVMVMQAADVLKINEALRPIFAYYAGAASDVGDNALAQLSGRASGTFGFPTIAGCALYLAFRAASVALQRRWVAYLALLPIILSGTRVAFAILVVNEFIVPLFAMRRPLTALTAGGVVAIGLYVLVTTQIQNLRTIFFFSFLRAALANPSGLAANGSLVMRLQQQAWALDNLDKVLGFGGVTSAEFYAHELGTGGAVDSELVLRSMQFGLLGYACFVIPLLWIAWRAQRSDFWALIVFLAFSAFTISPTTNYQLLPLVLLYALAARANAIRAEWPSSRKDFRAGLDGVPG